MIKEQYDNNSGAILFKKDPESLKLENVLKRVEELTKEVDSLKKKVGKLEKSSK